MAHDRSNDLKAFRDFADRALAANQSSLTLDEALERWEIENQVEAEQAATIDAIREGLSDMEAGRLKPAADSFREVCRRLGWSEPR